MHIQSLVTVRRQLKFAKPHKGSPQGSPPERAQSHCVPLHVDGSVCCDTDVYVCDLVVTVCAEGKRANLCCSFFFRMYVFSTFSKTLLKCTAGQESKNPLFLFYFYFYIVFSCVMKVCKVKIVYFYLLFFMCDESEKLMPKINLISF